MTSITPVIVLKALVKHETLTLPDLLLEKNLGASVPPVEVEKTLELLLEQKLVSTLAGVSPATYTITAKGIEEGERLNVRPTEVFN